MKKNVAGQTIGVQMVSASDGSAFTGTVSALVTGDAGTQTAGGGTVTHEGNGYHSYSITQAETNYDHVAVTFTGTGAIPATVQVYTTFPQTGDSFARLGAPAGASVSADVAAVKTQTAAIEVDTQDIQSRLPAALVSGRIDASVGAMAANVITATSIAADAITDAKVAADVTIASVTGSVGSVTAGVSVEVGGIASTSFAAGAIDSAAVAASAVTEIQSGLALEATLNTVAGYIDTEVASILAAVDTEVAAIKAKTDSLTFTVAGSVDANIQQINDVTIIGNGQTGTEFNV